MKRIKTLFIFILLSIPVIPVHANSAKEHPLNPPFPRIRSHPESRLPEFCRIQFPYHRFKER